jgi:DNA-binding NtrC family response regulator
MDDEDEVSSICGKILERAGHRVATCAEGETALRLYREASESGEPFDIVILDLTVPGGIGGIETIRRLRELDPKVKALVSSGYSNDPVMAEPASYGFSAVVPKPYNFEKMKSTVADLLDS